MSGKIRWMVGTVAAAGLLAVASVGSAFAADPTPGPGYGARGPVAGAVNAVCQGVGYGFAAVSEALGKLAGLTPEQVIAERQAGKSAVQIASENKVSEDALVQEVLANRKADLDEAVKAGRITQERADFMLGNMTDRVQDGLERTTAGPRGGGMGPAWQGQQGQRGLGQPGQGMGPGGMNRWAQRAQ